MNNNNIPAAPIPKQFLDDENAVHRVQYCVITDFEADDYIAIIMLIGNVIKQRGTTIHIHVSGSKANPTSGEGFVPTHRKWYNQHLHDLTTFITILKNKYQQETNEVQFPTITVTCSYDTSIQFDGNNIGIPNKRIYAEKALFIIGPMWDMGYTYNDKLLISGMNTFVYFGYNVVNAMVSPRNRSLIAFNTHINNIFDSDTNNRIVQYVTDDHNTVATTWFRSLVPSRFKDSMYCYNKPAWNLDTELENIGVDTMTVVSGRIPEINQILKNAEKHEPSTFVNLARNPNLPLSVREKMVFLLNTTTV